MQTDSPTVSEVVHEAVGLTDPDGHDDAIASMITAFEDDDRPARGVEDIAEVFGSTARGVDPEGDSPGARVTAAVATFLATSPEGGDDRGGGPPPAAPPSPATPPGGGDARPATLRVAVRTAYGDDVPEPVLEW